MNEDKIHRWIFLSSGQTYHFNRTFGEGGLKVLYSELEGSRFKSH